MASKITVTLVPNTDATIKFLLGLGLSPAIIDNVSAVSIQFDDTDSDNLGNVTQTESLVGDEVSIYKRVNDLKAELSL